MMMMMRAPDLLRADAADDVPLYAFRLGLGVIDHSERLIQWDYMGLFKNRCKCGVNVSGSDKDDTNKHAHLSICDALIDYSSVVGACYGCYGMFRAFVVHFIYL